MRDQERTKRGGRDLFKGTMAGDNVASGAESLEAGWFLTRRL